MLIYSLDTHMESCNIKTKYFFFNVSFRSWGTGDKQKENYRKGVFLENHTDRQTHTKMHHTHTHMQNTHRKTCMYTSNNP